MLPLIQSCERPWKTRFSMMSMLALSFALFQPQSVSSASRQGIVDSMTFLSTFDRGMEAELAKGDPSIHTRTSTQPEEVVRRGLHAQGQTQWVRHGGVKGSGALQFTDRDAAWIFYRGEKNVTYKQRDWSGTVSLWLKFDAEQALAPGYADPLQLTTRSWNDGAFFVDFNKDGDPRDFRLGAFADLKVWNPENKDIPESQRPLLPVKEPPFSAEHWTHVCFTWTGFNSGEKDGKAHLYLNGKDQGVIEGWNQQFTWKSDEAIRLYLGLNYIGWLDEVSCFDRPLTAKEVAWISNHPGQLVSE